MKSLLRVPTRKISRHGNCTNRIFVQFLQILKDIFANFGMNDPKLICLTLICTN